MEDLITTVSSIELPHGIETAFTAKLSQAIKSLEKGMNLQQQ